ncbi:MULTISPECIES: bifunctional diaminohydroxyphosphoribosylaminopyrimidine deaminase/5-amino-6-(5-phosphoribosylamino)uracil reductase RibD [Pseudidiomarina]|nr:MULTISPECIES: bifunctional diaminohydroxyphosphoribosylaminopyrimidine deaminase/5-amino-6-(5-phosphoribosylamino)uracil reductase RibD [Pseudidiomarina]
MTNTPVRCHQFYMQRALDLAAQGRFSAAPNPMVGCVIVQQGQIVGEGWHQRAGEPHAEVHALAAAGASAKHGTAYVTLEPCSHFGRTPPCADALIKAQVAQVVVAMQDPNPLVSGQGIARLRAAGIEVLVGVLETQARALNCGFIARMQRQRPWLRLKMAASLDGQTALANGASQWLTSSAARADVHRFRAQSSAILSTATTVLADQARLTARGEWVQQQPLRVIIDSQGKLKGDEPLFTESTATAAPILLVQGADLTTTRTWPEQVTILQLPVTNSGQIDLAELLHQLAQTYQINSVWTECGANLAGALIAAGWVDELILYLAPKLLGASAQGLFALPVWQQLAQAPTLTYRDVRQVGADLRITATINANQGDLSS